MHSIDSRGTELRAFDALAGELAEHYESRFEAGARAASRDVQRLNALAERLGDEVRAWSSAIRSLEAGATGRPLEPGRTGRLLIECVFDEALIPEATRVLAAALQLACPVP
jgi:hypothetical protein